eukprot:Gb_29077 [translate_table: standard]
MAISALPSVALPKYQYPLGVVKKNMRKFVELALESGVFFTTEGFGGRAKCDLVKEGSGGIVEELRMLSEKGRLKEALDLLHMMNQRDIKPDSNTYACLVQSCAAVKSVVMGKQVHLHMKKVGFEPDAVLQTKLVTMYSKCGNMENARQAFDEMPRKNVVTWTAMIAGYTQQRQGEKALLLFYEMQREGKKADQFTFASVLRACAGIRALAKGMQTHADIMKRGFESDLVLRSALVDMYAKCERIADARFVFEEMPERDIVSWNGLIAGYAKCGRMKDARQVFDEMPEKNVISWTAMIAGYTQNGHMEDALAVFYQMQFLGFRPDQLTYASLLRACAGLAALEQGKQIHAQVITSRLQSHFVLATALIDLYTKCGSIDAARHLFEKLPHRDAISWNAMIAGYGKHGFVKEALQLFEQMKKTGIKPDQITFIGLLSACNHAGLVDEGWHYFESISRDHGIAPIAEHYACMVDLLGRAGRLDEAHEFIKQMPIKPTAEVWGALLGACRVYFNMEIGRLAAEQLIELKPQNAGTYVVLSNIYATLGRWDAVSKIRKMMKDRGIKKEPGCSWIEIKKKMKDAGYVPNTNLVLHDADEEQKENILGFHSEKLPVALALISTPCVMPIRIVKNLSVCLLCHTAAKFISKIVRWEILVSDSTRTISKMGCVLLGLISDNQGK